MIFKKQFEWNSHIKRLLSYWKSFVNDSCGLKIFDLDYIISQVSTVDITDGIVWYKIKTKSKSASWTQPIINRENTDIQIVKAREDKYYHIMSFLSKLRDDINYIEKFEFPMLEYLGINNKEFELELLQD